MIDWHLRANDDCAPQDMSTVPGLAVLTEMSNNVESETPRANPGEALGEKHGELRGECCEIVAVATEISKQPDSRSGSCLLVRGDLCWRE
jgi:hypothetical protein